MTVAKAEGCIQSLPSRRRGVEGFSGEVEWLAVMGLQHKQAQRHWRDTAVEQCPDRGEVAQRFRHFGAADVDHAVVHPQLRQGRAVGGFGLGDFVFMVREHQIATAEMDVDREAEFLTHHGGAFDVPARTPWPPG